MKKSWEEMESWEKEVYRQREAVYNRISSAYDSLKNCDWSRENEDFIRGFNTAVEFLKIWVDGSKPYDED